MSLLAEAALDLRSFLEDVDHGFGVRVSVVSPDQVQATVTGYSADVGRSMDPETGLAVSGRMAHITVPTAQMLESFGEIPDGSPDSSQKPWLATVSLPGHPEEQTFRIFRTEPDKLGCIVCYLEAYE